jgi:hypothetical protein
MKLTKARLQEIIKEEIDAVTEAEGPEKALGKWAKMFPRAAKALEAMGAKIEDIKKAIDDAQPEAGSPEAELRRKMAAYGSAGAISSDMVAGHHIDMMEEEEPDMRTPAERYGKSMTEVGVLEELDGAIREAVQYVAIENLRDFLNDALKNILL